MDSVLARSFDRTSGGASLDSLKRPVRLQCKRYHDENTVIDIQHWHLVTVPLQT